MSQEKVFTPEELEAMGKLTLDLIAESIDADDKERAKALNKRMYREFLAMHDLYRDWITSLLSFIGRNYGDETLYQALKESVTAWIKPLCERYVNKSPRRKVEILAGGLKGHLQPLEIEEDEEKFIINMYPCGSGCRQISDGAYEPPRSFLKVKKAQPMTFNQPNFPVYCTHCFFQNIVLEELTGERQFVVEPPQHLEEEPCRVYVYK